MLPNLAHLKITAVEPSSTPLSTQTNNKHDSYSEPPLVLAEDNELHGSLKADFKKLLMTAKTDAWEDPMITREREALGKTIEALRVKYGQDYAQAIDDAASKLATNLINQMRADRALAEEWRRTLRDVRPPRSPSRRTGKRATALHPSTRVMMASPHNNNNKCLDDLGGLTIPASKTPTPPPTGHSQPISTLTELIVEPLRAMRARWINAFVTASTIAVDFILAQDQGEAIAHDVIYHHCEHSIGPVLVYDQYLLKNNVPENSPNLNWRHVIFNGIEKRVVIPSMSVFGWEYNTEEPYREYNTEKEAADEVADVMLRYDDLREAMDTMADACVTMRGYINNYVTDEFQATVADTGFDASIASVHTLWIVSRNFMDHNRQKFEEMCTKSIDSDAGAVWLSPAPLTSEVPIFLADGTRLDPRATPARPDTVL